MDKSPKQANRPQNTCIFCRIIAGEAKAFKIAETENFVSILDAFPVTEGHILVLPKSHYKTFFDVPEPEVASLFSEARKMASLQKKALEASGFNIATAPAAIDHFHVHVVPRYDYDMMGPLADLDNKREMSPEKMKEIFGKLVDKKVSERAKEKSPA